MMAFLSLLRTDVRDLRQPEWTSRGSRYWTQAEVPSSTLFIVEGCGGSTGRTVDKPMRFVTLDFFECLTICKQWALESITLLVYTRGDAAYDTDYAFGEICEAFGLGQGQPLVLHLASGSTLLLQANEMVQNEEVLSRLFPL